MRDKLKRINIPLVLIFVVLLFYLSSYIIDNIKQSKVIQQYKAEISKEELDKQKEISKEYNKNLEVGKPVKVEDAFASNGSQLVINLFNTDKPFGSVEIPAINVNLPIYEGTSERELQIGAGHLKGTSFPTGEIGTRSVITAHRGLQTAKMFRELDKLKEGDIFFIDTYGEKKAYEVFAKYEVEPDDTDSIKIIPNEDIVTLLTCTPYMINSHRLIVDGRRVEYIEKENKVKTTKGEMRIVKERDVVGYIKTMSFEDIEIIMLISISALVLLIFLIGFIRRRVKRRKEDVYDEE